MKPNLRRVSGSQDHLAVAILERAPGRMGQQFVDSLDPAIAVALGRYGVRAATRALRQHDPDLLRRSLLATGLAGCLEADDVRDLMVELALHWYVARQLDVPPEAVFADVADRLADDTVAEVLRTFGTRTDITLEAFGWQLVTTPDGPDFCPV
ncbi:hypothetical protein [Micromonospora humida]|uniref:hypothetical protein n=1 Tax=Micromonospora humida TaxID=2809018 RepID=UPI00341533F9